MIKRLNTRSEKIKFLTDLASGKTSIDILCDKPQKVEVWRQLPDEEHFTNGVQTKTREQLEEEDKLKKYKNRLRIVIVRGSRVPLAFRESDVQM
jgi:hypothetical protein